MHLMDYMLNGVLPGEWELYGSDMIKHSNLGKGNQRLKIWLED